jgi:cytochrome c oxidase subunit 2
MFFAVLIMLTACSSAAPQSAKDLPTGDASRGADLFTQSINGAPACSGCHTVDGSALVGPSFKGFGAIAGTRIAGTSAAEYTYQSITHPADFLVSGYGNLMYNQFATHLSPQQMADLIAYVLSR